MTNIESRKPAIMIVGVGNLAVNLLSMLLSNPATSNVILAGRDIDQLKRRANLARFAAFNLGVASAPRLVELDLWNKDRTAEVLANLKPDIIFMAASLQSWRVITQLPKEVFEALDEAQFGPWLPMHLALNYNLMQSVRASGITTKVVNAAFPDAVGPVLAKVGLAPYIGIGNVANIVPALTFSAAMLLNVPTQDVELRLTTQHYFSHYVPRFGHAGNGRYHLSVKSRGQHVSDIDHLAIFKQLNGPLKRIGGVDGQLLTASSAARIVNAMVQDTPVLAHAPAPMGLPGGYPVKISSKEVLVDLDGQISMDEAILINNDCQRADGIDAISDDGTVTFSGREMAVMRKMIGYHCSKMKLADVSMHAEELGAKYRQFSHQPSLKAA
jgi:hypothetical protein